MYPLSNALKSSFLSNQKKQVRITLNNNQRTNYIINDADIDANSFKIDRYCSLSGAVVVGSAVAAEMQMSLNNSDGKFDSFIFEGSDLKVEIGTTGATNQMEYIPCGHFTVDEIPIIGKKISIKSLDYMVRFDRPVDFSIFNSQPSMRNLLEMCCGRCNVDLSVNGIDSLPNISECVMQRPQTTNLTYRQIIQWIAQITGTCAYIDYNGRLTLSWFKAANVSIDTTNRYIGGKLSEKPITITGVKIKTSDSEVLSGTDDYSLVIEKNELIMPGAEQVIADNIYNVIGGFTYRPYSCNVFSLPFLYPLDGINYITADNETISTVVTNHNHSINGVSAISAVGESAQKKGYAVYGYKEGRDGHSSYVHTAYADSVESDYSDDLHGNVDNLNSDGILYVGTSTALISEKYRNDARIKKVIIPRNHVSNTLPSHVFNGCVNLEEVVILGQITTIQIHAFEGCTSLEKVTLPSSLQLINTRAFHDCNALTNVYYAGTIGQWGSITIYASNTYLTNATRTYGFVGDDSAVTVTGFDLNNYADKSFLGQYTDSNPNPSTNPSDYKWFRIKGEKGEKGDNGDPGGQGDKGDKGDPGDPGRSISSVVNYYLATNSSSGVTRSTSGWTEAVQSVSSTNKYLWNYEEIYYTGETTPDRTDPCIIGVYGADGKGISSITEYYNAHNSKTTAPTDTWYTTPQSMTSTNKYLWNYEKVTYTDGTYEETAKRVIGVYGDTGSNGKSIGTITNYYLATNLSSGVTTSSSWGWTETVQSVSSTNKYLWNYEKIKYSDGTLASETNPCIIGAYGADGKGISSITEKYKTTTTNTAPSQSGTWYDTPSAAGFSATNRYLWNYETITYTTGSPVKSATRLIGVWGEKGETGDSTDLSADLTAFNQAQTTLNKTLAASLGLHVTEKTVGGSKVWYFHSKPNLTSCVNGDTILVFNSNGFGVCKTGWNNGNPTFQYGNNYVNGSAVWNLLVANKVKATDIDCTDLYAIGANIGGWTITSEGIKNVLTDFEVSLNPLPNETTVMNNAQSAFYTLLHKNYNRANASDFEKAIWATCYAAQIVLNPTLKILDKATQKLYGIYPTGDAIFRSVNGMKFACGKKTITPTGTGITTGVQVKFSEYGFPNFKTAENVHVYATVETTSPHIVCCSVEDITISSFTLYLSRTNGTTYATDVHWFAIECG